MTALDLSARRRVHIVGIGGAGMSAIAAVLVAMGHEVTGSDLKGGPAIDRLRSIGVTVAVGHDGANLPPADVLACSTAIPSSNPEVLEARRRGTAVATRAETLAAIAALRRSVAVSGTHGKTTTSSMLALVLVDAELRPSFLIGGDVNQIGTNAVWDTGDWLVVEADESDGTFLALEPEIALVTSIEADHLDHYGSLDALEHAFQTFLGGARSAIVCADDPAAMRLAPSGALTYGFSESAALRITGLTGGRSDISFSLSRDGDELGTLALPVPGAHNAANAAAAVAAASVVGVGFGTAQRALSRFGGVARRFEFRGEARGVSFVDDYAHLPGEIAATLAAARRGGWRRIVCVFQPHRYSRVAALAGDFASSFVDADIVVLASVYPAGEAPRPGISSKLVLDALLDAHPTTRAAYLPERADLVAYLRRVLEPGDCCLTLGAGDLTTLPDELMAELS
ncbi:MAG TPA: UDP-N-acetylmuramate--L-alanine ligase [Acidimicrobiales bacterium]|nr:UDP-N-acetylmuramate--L-alanine ligase [Acidimicrobiales bacterium]